MRKINLVAGISLFSLLAAQSTRAGTPPPGTLDIPALVQNVDKGVVNIQAVTLIREQYVNPIFEDFFFQSYGVPRERIRRQASLGSGFVIDDGGYILTNHHVIDRAEEVEVSFEEGGQQTKLKAKVVGSDRKIDVALLQVEKGGYLHPLHLGNSDLVRVGESVVAIGNPFGLSHTVTAGIISAKNRVIGEGPYDNFLQTDASINPGNSGGPLFNSAGEVIGINAAISSAGQGLGFAIPINQVTRVIKDLKEYGRVRRGWVGALFVNAGEGVMVDAVVLRSGAEQAGMQGGDRVVSVEGMKVQSAGELERQLEGKKPGDMVTFELRREGRLFSRGKKVQLKLGEEPESRRELPPGLL